MNTSSAFARVIGITRSLSPLSFDRGQDRNGEPDKNDETATDAAESPSTTATDTADEAQAPESNIIGPKWLDESGTPETVIASGTVRLDEPAVFAEDIDDPFGFSGPATAPVDAGVVVQFPALAQVTVVQGVQPSTEASAAEPSDTFEKSPSGDLIDAIQSDVAALLASEQPASMEAEGPDEDVMGDEGVAEAPAADDDEQAEEPTLALLSELNRMWQADPNVTANRWP